MIKSYCVKSIHILAATLLCIPAMIVVPDAHATITVKRHQNVRLSEDMIRQFLSNMSALSVGAQAAGDDEVAQHLYRHIAEDGTFKSAVTYDIPGYPSQDVNLSLSKMEYIAATVDNRARMQDFESTLEISDIRFTPTRNGATLKSLSKDKGKISVPDQQSGTQKILPVTGETHCTQKIGLDRDGTIQLREADCRTLIKFDPWQGQDLEAEW